eukprot:m.53352 g.53352  ORF g.53352 m.53352 type:complete len:330 (-) comp6759_c0_seq2:17-1006(-)
MTVKRRRLLWSRWVAAKSPSAMRPTAVNASAMFHDQMREELGWARVKECVKTPSRHLTETDSGRRRIRTHYHDDLALNAILVRAARVKELNATLTRNTVGRTTDLIPHVASHHEESKHDGKDGPDCGIGQNRAHAGPGKVDGEDSDTKSEEKDAHLEVVGRAGKLKRLASLLTNDAHHLLGRENLARNALGRAALGHEEEDGGRLALELAEDLVADVVVNACKEERVIIRKRLVVRLGEDAKLLVRHRAGLALVAWVEGVEDKQNRVGAGGRAQERLILVAVEARNAVLGEALHCAGALLALGAALRLIRSRRCCQGDEEKHRDSSHCH